MVILLSVVLFAAIFSGAVSLVVRLSGRRPPSDVTRVEDTPVVSQDPHAGWKTFSDVKRPVRRDDPPANTPTTASQADFDAWEAEHWPKRRTR